MSDEIRCYRGAAGNDKGKPVVEGLDHRKRHSLQGRLDWGTLNNGAKDLAYSILSQWFDEEDAERFYLHFASECIAHIPPEGTQIMRDQVAEWMEYAKSNE
jgi:hypothetical protein